MKETLDELSLARAGALYDQGLSRQAYDLVAQSGPLHQFTGTRSRIIGSRIAMNLGARKLANWLAIHAWRDDRDDFNSRCYFIWTRFERGGPFAGWQFLRWCDAHPPRPAEDPYNVNHFHTIRARIAWSFRDFETAEAELERAEAAKPNQAWTYVERSSFYEAQDRYQEALETARRALEIRPWYRPAIQGLAHCLQLIDRDEEALDLLRLGNTRVENVLLLMQQAQLEQELELWSAAGETIDRMARLCPCIEEDLKHWIVASRTKLAHGQCHWKAAASYARQMEKDAVFEKYAERAENEASPRKRVRLPVEFVRQHHLTCAPATLSALSRFWKKPAEHLEVAEEICYDGTPSHSERNWAETHGWVVREFTVTLPAAKALLDRGIPFTLTTMEVNSAHLQACIGYDELRETLIIRDPFHYYATEFISEPFLKCYAAHGPRGMAMVPEESAGLFDKMDLPEAALHDRLYEVNRALCRHDRNAAEHIVGQMTAEAPQHRLTLVARRSLAGYDANTPANLAVLNELLQKFPDDGHFQLARLSCLRELGRREERLSLLQKLVARKAPEPIFFQAFADELRVDAREHEQARRWIARALRRSLDSQSLGTLADLLWSADDYEEALLLYRFAACLDDKHEPFSRSYFLAARSRKRTEVALKFLQERIARLGKKSGGPAATLFQCLEVLDRTEEGFKVLEQAMQLRPEESELRLFAANAYLRLGHLEQAAALVDSVGANSRRPAVIRAQAEIALLRGERAHALALWRELLQFDPLALDAHENVARLLGELEGRAAALAHLASAREKFPQHYGLHHLSTRWVRNEGPQATEPVVRQLLAIDPADVWARRELASVLAESGRLEEALTEASQAIKLDPSDTWSHSMRGQIHARANKEQEARDDFMQALRAGVDNPAAIHGLIDLCHSPAERKQALAFLEQEFVRQIVFGGGLEAFREVMNLHQEPSETLTSLRVSLRERPDLAPAWSVVVNQLTDMGQFDEALGLAQQAVERFSLLPNAWMDLAQVRRAKGDLPGEIEALQRAAELTPHSAEPCWRLANAYDRSHNSAAALRALEQGASRQPFAAPSHAFLADCLWTAGNREEALRRMKLAIELDPDYGWAWDRFLDMAREMKEFSLGESYARELTERLPGQARPWLMLANALHETKKNIEALAALHRALQYHPRYGEAHDLRACLLASERRYEEALAACHPAAFGSSVPMQLQARAAWIEDTRGRHRTAIELMRAVVAEHPAFHWGWQQLAEWYFRAEELDDAVNAATQMARLEPFNAVPLGYRAELKLHHDDRAGAKEDLARAFKLDPNYDFAVWKLFGLQLEDKELDQALQTLSLLRQVGDEWRVLVSELRLVARIMHNQVEATPEVSKAYPKPRHTARELLIRASTSPNVDPEYLHYAIETFYEGGQEEFMDELLEELMALNNVQPYLGTIWAERRYRRGIKHCDRTMKRLLDRDVGKEALVCLLQLLSEDRKQWSFNRLLRKHREWLHPHANGWVAVAYGLNNLRKHREVLEWCDNWRNRTPLDSRNLLNLHVALGNMGQEFEALKIARIGECLPGVDEILPRFKLLSAFGYALDGDTHEAQNHAMHLKAEDLPEYYRLLFALFQAVVKVQCAPLESRREAYQEARGDVRAAFGRQHISHCDRALRIAYRNAFRRMAADAKLSCWREILRTYLF